MLTKNRSCLMKTGKYSFNRSGRVGSLAVIKSIEALKQSEWPRVYSTAHTYQLVWQRQLQACCVISCWHLRVTRMNT